MKRLFVTSVAPAIALLLLAARAFATTPTPFIFEVPAGIQLAGQSAGVVDPRAEARVRVLTNDQQPIVNATVQILFGNCAGNDVHLDDVQPHHPGVLFDCATRTVSAVSNPQGVATFRLLGGASSSPGNPPGLTSGCATIRVDGVVIAVNMRVGAYDQDGKNGVNAADQALFMATLFAGPSGYRTRADFNGDGLCNSADLGRMLSVLLGGGSTTSSAAPFCF